MSADRCRQCQKIPADDFIGGHPFLSPKPGQAGATGRAMLFDCLVCGCGWARRYDEERGYYWQCGGP